MAINDEIKILAREEYKEEFEKIEKENKQILLENHKYKEQLAKLKNFSDFNSPQAKEIINSLILISEIPI